MEEILIGRKEDDFVNDKIRELRNLRNEKYKQISEYHNKSNSLREEIESIQEEIDNEFIRQMSADVLKNKFVISDNVLFHIIGLERTYTGIKFNTDVYLNFDSSDYHFRSNTIDFADWSYSLTFDEIDHILNEPDKGYRIISDDEAIEIIINTLKSHLNH